MSEIKVKYVYGQLKPLIEMLQLSDKEEILVRTALYNAYDRGYEMGYAESWEEETIGDGLETE